MDRRPARYLSARLLVELDFASAIADDLQNALERLSTVARVRRRLGDARAAIGALTVELPEGVSVSLRAGTHEQPGLLEDRLRDALREVGRLAARADRGVVFLYDEAHTVFDRPREHQFPLGALLGAFVQVQDDADEELPVMLAVVGLPPLVTHLQAARSHAERLFKAEGLGNLSLEPSDGELSAAALALVRPAEENGLRFNPKTAERVVHEVDGYPYFIQWFGEALWDAAEDEGVDHVDERLYERTRERIQDGLDVEFFEGRYLDVNRGEQVTLRVAASLGGEGFRFNDLAAAFARRKANATQQSVNRLLQGNVVYRVRHGEYAYTAPLFGDFLRRKHPRAEEDL